MPDHVRIAIIGSGFAGMGMAIRLKEAGIDDFTVLERAGDVGGTWRDNTYPGCACDVPSHLYSFSFAPNPGWSRTFSFQPEIQAYLQKVAADHGLAPYLRFGHDVTSATWDEERARWAIQTAAGDELTAQFLIPAMGALSAPSIPDLPGLDTFEGTTFHSASWDHGHDLRGERLAVVGTGASAIQFVPRVAEEVARLHLFQRTPPWILPRPDRPITAGERTLYSRLPAAQRAMRAGIYWARELFVLGFRNRRIMSVPERIARRHLARSVPDRALRAELTPDYQMGCKRVLISNDYLPALTRPNVEVIAQGVREVRPRSVVAADGSEREVDTIIFGTGFHISDMPASERIRGIGGRLLGDVWQGSPEALRGTTMAGFPNLFMLAGPNTGLGHNSMVYMIESQIEYVMDCLRRMEEAGAARLEVRPEAQAAYNARIESDTEGTVWTTGCRSWYLGADGRNRMLWPRFSWQFRRRTEAFDPAEYALR